MLQVDNDVATVTVWSGDFWELPLEFHTQILQKLDSDDPDIRTLYELLRQRLPSSAGRRRGSTGGQGRGSDKFPCVPIDTSSVSVLIQVPADAFKFDVFTLVNSRRDTPGFAISVTYGTVDWACFNAIFAGWPSDAEFAVGSLPDALVGKGRFIHRVQLDFVDDLLHTWCDFARFRPAQAKGAAISKNGNTVRFLLRMNATFTMDLRAGPGRQVRVVFALWICNVGPHGIWKDAAANKNYFNQHLDYADLKRRATAKCAELFPQCAPPQVELDADLTPESSDVHFEDVAAVAIDNVAAPVQDCGSQWGGAW